MTFEEFVTQLAEILGVEPTPDAVLAAVGSLRARKGESSAAMQTQVNQLLAEKAELRIQAALNSGRIKEDTAKTLRAAYISPERLASGRPLSLRRFNEQMEIIETLEKGAAVPVGGSGVVELSRNDTVDHKKLAEENVRLRRGQPID